MSNLVEHAKRELSIIGYNPDADASSGDINDLMSAGLVDLVQRFADQGHSGASAAYAVSVLSKLLSFENLTPLTDRPDEWHRHEGHGANGGDLWQNKRNGEAFSEDGGKTYRLNSEAVWEGEEGNRSMTKAPLRESVRSVDL